MTQSRFFQIALFFPFVIWCFFLLASSLISHQSNDLMLKNLYDGYRVFVPYLIFSAGVWKLASNKPYRVLLFMAFVLPLIWGVFFTFFYIILTYFREASIDKWYVLCIMAFWAAIVAYIAEFIPFILLTVFKDNFRPTPSDLINGATLDQYQTQPKS